MKNITNFSKIEDVFTHFNRLDDKRKKVLILRKNVLLSGYIEISPNMYKNYRKIFSQEFLNIKILKINYKKGILQITIEG